MRPRVLWCAALLPMLLSAVSQAGEVADQVVACSVEVHCPDGYGAGTLVRHGGRVRVLTAGHVVSGVKPDEVCRVTMRRGKGKLDIEARVLRYDRLADLALLQLSPDAPADLPTANLGLGVAELEPGEDVLFCGPGGGLPYSLIHSFVNQERDGDLLVNGEAWFGHSGSGVYVKRDGKWLLVGVISRTALPLDDNPRTPTVCVGRAAIKRFLAE